MNVYWTPRAKKHLDSIYEYIAQDSESAALSIVDTITSRSKQIELFPNSGRVVEHLQDVNIRELIEGKYRIVYHIIRERIDIIAVVHTSRNTLLG